MSEIVIALLLITAVLLVVLLLSYTHKKKKKKARAQLETYLQKVGQQSGFKSGFQKQLVHQTVLIDETARKILILNHHWQELSHELLSLDYMKTSKVINRKQTVRTDEQSKKTEIIVTQIGVEIVFDRPEKEIFLLFYDHIEHNIFQMADLEKEARDLQERIAKAKAYSLIA